MRLFFAIISIWFVICIPIRAASLSGSCNANSFVKDCNKDDLAFIKYKIVNGKATFKYKIDPGPIGEISADEAFNSAVESLGRWQEVSCLNFIAKDDGKISKDVTANNYQNYVDTPSPLGYSTLIWDNDGSIVEDLVGEGSRNGVLAFAGSTFFIVVNGDVTAIKESQAMFNGYFFNGDNTGRNSSFIKNQFRTTILHEIGHMLGIDHAQGADLERYLNKTSDLTTIPIMFPIVANSVAELQHDDIAIAKDAYPQGNENQNYGRIEGSLTDAGIGIRGANIIAFKVDDNNPYKQAVSCPSDVDGHRTGNFVLPILVPGEYIVFAEPIYSVFTGGSSIGLYGAIDPSKFATGFYNGEKEPIIKTSDLNTGIAQAKRITVVAGSTQTVNFEINSDNNGNNIEPSFTALGEAFSKPHSLRLNKNTRTQIVLNNLNKSSKRLLIFITDYPDLVKFSPSNTVNIYRKDKILKVTLAPYKDFLEQFPELQNSDPVAIPVTITDFSTGYTKNSESITVF